MKAQALQQQKLEKERTQKQKSEEKEQKRLQSILQKYGEKIKRIVQVKTQWLIAMWIGICLDISRC